MGVVDANNGNFQIIVLATLISASKKGVLLQTDVASFRPAGFLPVLISTQVELLERS